MPRSNAIEWISGPYPCLRCLTCLKWSGLARPLGFVHLHSFAMSNSPHSPPPDWNGLSASFFAPGDYLAPGPLEQGGQQATEGITNPPPTQDSASNVYPLNNDMSSKPVHTFGNIARADRSQWQWDFPSLLPSVDRTCFFHCQGLRQLVYKVVPQTPRTLRWSCPFLTPRSPITKSY
jgi:hypothetical protein